jgi:hypothetical protein
MPRDLLAFIAENANQPKAGAYARLILKPMRDSYAGVLVE